VAVDGTNSDYEERWANGPQGCCRRRSSISFRLSRPIP